MPFNDPDATDPMSFHAVEVETGDPAAIQEMAACFVEEYLRMGFSRERILGIFSGGGFAGPALAYRSLGLPRIAKIIEDQYAIRRPHRALQPAARDGERVIELPIVD